MFTNAVCVLFLIKILKLSQLAKYFEHNVETQGKADESYAGTKGILVVFPLFNVIFTEEPINTGLQILYPFKK